MGHYTGLMQLGPEAYGANAVPVYASERMCGFLRANGPWSLLVKSKNIDLRVAAEGASIELAANVAVTPLRVPHRDEFSDTFGFIIAGPSRSLLYIPDIDKWDRWETRIEDVLGRVDIALIDGDVFRRRGDSRTLDRPDSTPLHRGVDREVQRPAGVRAQEDRLHSSQPHQRRQRSRGAAASEIARAGMSVASDGQIIPL